MDEKKQSLVLSDGTIIDNVIEVYAYSFKKECLSDEMAQIYNAISDRQLTEITHKTGDIVTAIYKDKKIKSCSYENGIATFTLADVDKTEQRLTALEETIDILVIGDLGGIDYV